MYYLDYAARRKLFLQCIPGCIGTLYEDIANSLVFTQAMNVCLYLDAFLLKDALVGVFLTTCHIVIGMVACNHHEWHDGNLLDFLCFQLRNDSFQAWPALYSLNEHVIIAQLLQLR